MRTATAQLWERQDRHPGDRFRLFSAVAGAVEAQRVLSPGSFVDLAPSFVWPDVTYVDTDARAERFFDDDDGVRELIASQPGAPHAPMVTYVRADYTTPLAIPSNSFDLLVSLYAGPVSKYCTRYLRIGGSLLVNPSHGDVALASLDGRYDLHAVVEADHGRYRVTGDDLDAHLVPKASTHPSADEIEQRARSVAYTKSAFAYVFRRAR